MTTQAPDPPRPLGNEGLRMWERFSRALDDREALLLLCEALDERQMLRVRVLRDGNNRDRAELRRLENLIAEQTEAIRRDASWAEVAL